LALAALSAIALIAVGIIWVGRLPRPYQLHGRVVEPSGPAADFALTTASGHRVGLRDFRDKVVLIYFGYTHCPDVCPATVSEVRRVWKQLGDDAQQAQFIMITVDPERDTAEKLAAYVSYFDPSFLGLTGTQEEIQAAADGFGVFFKADAPESEAGYLVSHTASLMLIDRKGLWRAVYPFGTPAEEIAPDIRHLINE
jgi:protein SCO1/2